MSPEEIKALRLKLKMSQQQFAERIGVSRPQVSFWERGHMKPSRLAEIRLRELRYEWPKKSP